MRLCSMYTFPVKMADKVVVITQPVLKPIKLIKWKVNEGNSISIGCVYLLYVIEKDDKRTVQKMKSTQAGTVHKLLAQEGDVVKMGAGLLELQSCTHPTVMRDMCAECGADLRKDDAVTVASVPMIHSVPELKVSLEQAKKIGKADTERLLKDRKLVLLVDLDQTLIHTTNDNIPPNIKDVYHFQLYGPQSPWYHTRLRPGTHRFLANMSPLFELHICTFGARNYAHMIAMFLDQDGKLFSHRILSRDECFNPTSKTANLKALFPCGDNMVCIIDDREDVWSYAANLIHVKPYHFFQHTGDINAPPGLDKHESDEKEGVDLTKVALEKEKKIKANGAILKKAEEEDDVPPEKNDNVEEKSEETGDVSAEDNSKHKEESSKGDEEIPNEGEKLIESSKDDEVIESKDEKLIESKDDELIESKDEKLTESKDNELIESKSNKSVQDIGDKLLETKEVPDSGEDTSVHLESNNKAQTESNPTNTSKTKEGDTSKQDDFIEIEDSDDYLLYLEDILRTIHKAFYDKYDKMEAGNVPDLKKVIPEVRRDILKGTKLVFSGLVPTHIKLEQSKAYQVAKSLGASVTQDLEEDTTHLVAVRPGTAKVNAGRRRKCLKIVTPDWLWACAERWSKVEEMLYPLSNKGSKNRHPPPHCSSPEHNVNFEEVEETAVRKRTPSGRFMDTINPLMSFSTADIADMDREVEDIFNESESESESSKRQGDSEDVLLKELKKCKESDEESSSSDESLTGEHPHGWRPARNALKRSRDDQENEDDSTADEFPSTKFRRGEQLSSDLDIGQDSNSEGSADAPDEIDDGDWNMMGAALEREFLANN